MNNNESFNLSRGNSSDPSATAMTAEELALYKEVLLSAYPKPKRDIKAGVMKAVLRDTAMKKKRADTRALIMKWGGLAASIVLVAMVGIRVLPSFMRDASVEYAADAAYIEQSENASATEDTAFSSTRSFKVTTTSSSDTDNGSGETYAEEYAEVTSEEAAPEVDGIEAEYGEEAAPEDQMMFAAYIPSPENSAEEEAVYESPAAEEVEEAIEEEAMPVTEEAVMMPAAPDAVTDESPTEEIVIAECTHTKVFGDSYHLIPQYLIDTVGKDHYIKWVQDTMSAFDPCTVNILSFIDHFEIGEDVFTRYLCYTDDSYTCDYPLDILYGDREACEEYYRNGGNREKMLADNFEYRLKLALIEEISADEYEAWLTKFAYPTVRAWSISEFVTEHSIPEPRFNEIYDIEAEKFMDEYGLEDVHGYNTMLLYVNTVGTKFALAASAFGYEADVACRK